MVTKRTTIFTAGTGVFWALLVLAGPSSAATLTATVGVTIATGGGVGAVAVEPVTAVAETTGDTTGDGELTTTTGDAVTVISSTFREISTAPEIQITAAGPAVSTGNATSSSNVTQRFSAGSRAAAQIFGGTSSVAVSGVPNQTFNITLPGETTYSTGAETVDIAEFLHDAGATPQLSSEGTTTFTVAAQLNDDNVQASADGDSDVDVDEVGSVQQILSTPIVTRSPFVGITVSYN